MIAFVGIVGIVAEKVDGLLAFEINQTEHFAFGNASAPGLTGRHDRILQDLGVGVHGQHLPSQAILIDHQHGVFWPRRKASFGTDSMKTATSELAAHLVGEVTTLATCWKITRRDGVVLGFTDHIRDLDIDGVTYRAASGYTRTAIRSTADLAVDNLDVESVFSDDGITEADLRADH